MAKEKKKFEKKPIHVSFPGIFKFPKLTEPDYGTEEYPKPDGEFSVRLVGKPDDPQVKAMMAKIAPVFEQAKVDGKAKAKELSPAAVAKLKKKNGDGLISVNDYYADVLDKDTGEKTGDVEFKLAMTYSGTYKKGPKQGKKWYRKPPLFDAKGQPMKNPPEIWGGTKGRISFTMGPYFVEGNGMVGVKLYLEAARILDLVSKGERSAAAYGFGEEEEGYTYDAATEAATAETAEATDDDMKPAPKGKAAAGDDDNNPDF